MSNRSAAGLRRSAIVARIRLREEWSELKGPEEPTKSLKQIPEIIRKNQKPVRSASKLVAQKVRHTRRSPNSVLRNKNQNIVSNVPISERNMDSSTDALRGVVALVDVGTETRALALRAALMALGATVVPVWSPFVTHLVWTQGGCRDTRAKARALACRLVSPLWVEACASCGRRVTEAAFPAATRASDLPSPRALRIMLKRAEAENIPLSDLLNANNNNKERNPKQQLRISSETENDTSSRTDTTHDTSTEQDTSRERSRDSTDPTIRVNTLPRGGHAQKPPEHPKSRRKLFTHREGQDLTHKDDDDTPAVPKRTVSKITQRERKELARAERMARKMLGTSTPAKTQQILSQTDSPRIVLTGMSRTERQTVQNAIKILNGRVQKHVNHRTTHVVLGSCLPSENRNNPDNTGIHPLNQTMNTCKSHCSKATSINTPKIPSKNTGCGIESVTSQFARCGIEKARTLNALLGAARGCRVVYAQWIADSFEVRKWLHHHGYEVPHLRKISQKARVERNALGRTCADYAYDVFKGMRVRISPHTDQRDAAIQLLKLCGGIPQDVPNGGQTGSQNGGTRTADHDISLGSGEGEVSSKWVFDSVAAGRMRTTRRYVNLTGETNR